MVRVRVSVRNAVGGTSIISRSQFSGYTCAVDTNAAGNGNLEVTVTNPAGSTMYNYVRPIGPTIYGVYFTPTQSGMHLVNVSFNGEVVCGLSLSDS